MGKNRDKNKRIFKRTAAGKKNTAVTFDPQERQNYLRGLIGAKKRRRQHYMKKAQEEEQQSKKQERADFKAQRKEQLKKAKELLHKLSDRAENDYRSRHDPTAAKPKKEVEVNQANNLVVETQFF